MNISTSHFGYTDFNEEVIQYTLLNDKGCFVKILNYGGIITNINVPDKDGYISNVVFGYENFEDYKTNRAYLGALIGGVAGRISDGKFEINNTSYTLPQNNYTNCLHGGLKGFDKKIWSAKTRQEENKTSLILNYLSADMEEGFPGNYNLTVTYEWDNQNQLSIHYTATTDKETVHAPTNHTYFNLSNDLSSDILDHELMIKADKYIEINDISIPTKISDVENTPFDFRKSKKVIRDLDLSFEQLKLGSGYNHPFILRDNIGTIATLYCEKSGRLMEVISDQEALVLYTGNFLNETIKIAGANGAKKNGALCLETQYIPNNMNFHEVKTHTLKPGEVYNGNTIFKFLVKG